MGEFTSTIKSAEHNVTQQTAMHTHVLGFLRLVLVTVVGGATYWATMSSVRDMRLALALGGVVVLFLWFMLPTVDTDTV